MSLVEIKFQSLISIIKIWGSDNLYNCRLLLLPNFVFQVIYSFDSISFLPEKGVGQGADFTIYFQLSQSHNHKK